MTKPKRPEGAAPGPPSPPTPDLEAIKAKQRATWAKAERLPRRFQEADAEALPFADGQFDVVLSSFGVMFAPNHVRSEYLEVVVVRS